MNKEIEIPEGYEANIEGNKVILKPKESEDERIRKDIIAYFEGKRDKNLPSGMKQPVLDAWIAYLEKQKEQKPVEYLDKDKVYAIMTKLTNLSYSQLIPINSDEFKKLDEITTDVRSLLDYPIEQKPAEWNEDDKRILDEAIGMVEAKGCWIRSDDAVKQVSDFLKSLPERFNLQPKQEWSEEDELTIADLINYFEGDSLECSAEEMVQRIKSLRPQPHWKPSEEQMKYLAKAIKTLGEEGDGKTSAVLNELRCGLKKL